MIHLTGVKKEYTDDTDKAVHALRGVDLHINEGEIFGIIGKSGAGKSTLIRCINMLEQPTAGTVSVNGQELSSLDESGLRLARKKISMIFQHFHLLSNRTVFENIAFPLELQGVSKEKIAEQVMPLLALVDLTDKKNQYPSQLSGGQKQRVGIARALASKPQVLLCDEATSALDPQTTKSILQLLQNINKQFKLTVVLITHEMQVIKEICHRVAVMENGLVIEQGSVLELFTQPKSPTTREFINTVTKQDLPLLFANSTFSATSFPGSSLVLRLSFIGHAAGEPIIADMAAHYQVSPNILYGNIDQIQNTPFGTLVIEMAGTEAQIQGALAYLEKKKLGIEVIGHVCRND